MSNMRKGILTTGISITIMVLLIIVILPLFRQVQREDAVEQVTPLVPRKHSVETDIFILTLDTTRADSLGAYGNAGARTPNLDQFARRNVLFSQTISPVPMTLPAHCSLFTGLYPPTHGVRSNANFQLPNSVETLAEKLKGLDYHTMGIVSSFTVDSRFGIGRGFDYFDDRLDHSHNKVKTFNSERRANSVIDSFRKKLPDFVGKKLFCWLHFFDPHAPYDPPGIYTQIFSDQRYDGEVAYMDHWIGQVFASINARRAERRRFMVIVGDHGEAFGEHGEFGHQIFCYQQNIHIPLIISALEPVASCKIVTNWTSLVDIKPTVFDVLQVPVLTTMQGNSLAGFLRGEKADVFHDGRPLYFESLDAHLNLGYAPITGAILNDVKMIDVPDIEIFLLREDPRERANLHEKSSNDETLSGEMFEKLRNYIASVRDTGEIDTNIARRTMSTDEIRQLQALGYLSPDQIPTERNVAKTNLPDAKELKSILKLFNKGQEAEKKGEWEDAITQYQAILTLSRCYIPAILRLAAIHQTRSPDDALKIFQTARGDCPENKNFLPDFVNLLIEMEKFDQAEQLLDEEKVSYFALPENEVVYWFLSGSLHEKRAAIPKAIAAFSRSFELEPENKFLGARIAGLHLQTGDIASALRIYKKLLADFPADVDIVFNSGVLFARSGDFRQAEFLIRNAISLDPKPHMYFDLGFILAQQRKFKDAVAAMQQYLAVAGEKDANREKAQEMIDSWQAMPD